MSLCEDPAARGDPGGRCARPGVRGRLRRRRIPDDIAFHVLPDPFSERIPVVGTSPVTVVDRVRVANQPDPVLFVDGSIWVGHFNANGLERIDPTTGKVVATVAVRSPIDLVEAFGSIWVAELNSDTVARVDPASNAIVDRIPVGSYPDGITAASAPSGP